MSSGSQLEKSRQRFARARGIAQEDQYATEVPAAEFTALLARVVRDPELVSLELMEPPVADEMRQLRTCLRRAPHVAEVRLTSSRFKKSVARALDLELWLEAVPPARLVYLEDEGVSAAFMQRLGDFGAQRLRFYRPQLAEVPWIVPSQTLRHLHLEYDPNMGRDSDLAEETRLFRAALEACTALVSLHLEHGDLSEDAVAALSDFVGSSASLTSLELDDSLGANANLDPLWLALRDSKTSRLERLALSADGQKLTGFDEFLAAPRARAHLIDLELASCALKTACVLLPAVAEHCDGLISLQLAFASLDVPIADALFNYALATQNRRAASRSLVAEFRRRRIGIGSSALVRLSRAFHQDGSEAERVGR